MGRSFHRRLSLLPLPLLLPLAMPDAVASPCDESLVEQAGGVASRVRYRARPHDDRCEGFYHS